MFIRWLTLMYIYNMFPFFQLDALRLSMIATSMGQLLACCAKLSRSPEYTRSPDFLQAAARLAGPVTAVLLLSLVTLASFFFLFAVTFTLRCNRLELGSSKARNARHPRTSRKVGGHVFAVKDWTMPLALTFYPLCNLRVTIPPGLDRSELALLPLVG